MDFYKSDDSYVLTTGESPKGFRNVLYIAWSVEDDGGIMECVLSVADLAAMTSVEIVDVPDEWYNAFSDVSGLFAKREVKVKVEPDPTVEPEPAVEPEPTVEPESAVEPEPEPDPEPEPELWSVTLNRNELVLIALGWFTWSVLKYSLIWPITGAF